MTSPRAAARTANNGAATALPLRAVRAGQPESPPRFQPRTFLKKKINYRFNPGRVLDFYNHFYQKGKFNNIIPLPFFHGEKRSL